VLGLTEHVGLGVLQNLCDIKTWPFEWSSTKKTLILVRLRYMFMRASLSFGDDDIYLMHLGVIFTSFHLPSQGRVVY
jgi:hypothetical protein